MTRRWLGGSIAGLLLVLLAADRPRSRFVLGPVVTITALGAGSSEISGPAMRAGSSPTWLPAGLAVCTSLGVDATACNPAAIMNASALQTDPALWFDKVTSTVGPALDGCESPRAIQTYETIAGSTGTTYLCRAPTSDDIITDTALAALRSRVTALARVEPVTLADHLAAVRIKATIRYFVRHPS